MDTNEGDAIGKSIRGFRKKLPLSFFGRPVPFGPSGITLHALTPYLCRAFHAGGIIRMARAAQLLYVQNSHVTAALSATENLIEGILLRETCRLIPSDFQVTSVYVGRISGPRRDLSAARTSNNQLIASPLRPHF